MKQYSFDAAKTAQELILWVKNYFEEAGADSKAVLGMSGGKDSSVCAAVLVKALGADRPMRLEATAMHTARSAAGSLRARPPATLMYTSWSNSFFPARFSITARSSATRLESMPPTVRLGTE